MNADFSESQSQRETLVSLHWRVFAFISGSSFMSEALSRAARESICVDLFELRHLRSHLSRQESSQEG